MIKVGDLFRLWKVEQKLEDYRFRVICTGCNITERVFHGSYLRNGSYSCGCKSKQKRKQTNLERHGVEYSSQSESIKDKIKQTNLERYGVDNPRKNKQIIKKIQSQLDHRQIASSRKQTIKQKYGEDNASKVRQFNNKRLELFKKRYGGNAPIICSKIRNKIKQTNLERYGVTNPLLSEKIRQKQKQTIRNKYGVDNPSQILEIREQLSTKLSTGELVVDVYTKYQVPSSTANKVFRESGEQVFYNFCENYTNTNHSSLKVHALELFKQIDPNLQHHNKAPLEQVEIRCRPDFRIQVDDKFVYVNVDGLYYHSEKKISNKNYHFNLRKHFEAKQINLLQFRQDEIYNHPEIVLSIIKAKLQISKKIYARKCTVARLTREQIKPFLKQNHLMGDHPSSKGWGLFYNNQLVQLITVKNHSSYLDIARLCSLNNTTVVGGFSKLLNAVKKYYTAASKIISYCDLRYSSGTGYEKLGFKRQSITLGWKWTDSKSTFNRRRCRANHDDRRLTEAEYAAELKWYKIYDAGQAKYVIDNLSIG